LVKCYLTTDNTKLLFYFQNAYIEALLPYVREQSPGPKSRSQKAADLLNALDEALN
jgi:hypothetical protein